MIKRATLAACALLLCVLFAQAHAQQPATATFSGIVTDPNGAVISGARVKPTQQATRIKRETGNK